MSAREIVMVVAVAIVALIEVVCLPRFDMPPPPNTRIASAEVRDELRFQEAREAQAREDARTRGAE